ncbi:hypothetical protein BsWGS_08389 [Bradybaena similaris]
MSAEASCSQPGDEGRKSKSPSEDRQQGTYECNICLETANDPVVSLCGHLYCWPCLHQWLEIRPSAPLCPVCKAAISKDKVIPIYGRGNPNPEDPRKKLPPRPAGQRSEADTSNRFQNFGFGDNNFQLSFGFGAFPFGIFASSFSLNDGRNTSSSNNTPQQAEEQFLSKVFLWVAIIFIIWLIIA